MAPRLRYEQTGKTLILANWVWNNVQSQTLPPFPAGFRAAPGWAVSFTPIVPQVQTDTVSTVVASTVYTLTIGLAALQTLGLPPVQPRSVTFNSGGAPTATTIAAGLVAAVQADPILNGLVTVSNAAGVITITARNAGQSFTVTSDANQTVGAATFGSLPQFAAIGKTNSGAIIAASAAFTGLLDIVIDGL